MSAASARLVAAAASVLPLTDTWCTLYLALRKVLRSDIKVIDELTILAHAEAPVRTLRTSALANAEAPIQVSRLVYDAAVSWASRATNSAFWRLPQPATGQQAPELRNLGRHDE